MKFSYPGQVKPFLFPNNKFLNFSKIWFSLFDAFENFSRFYEFSFVLNSGKSSEMNRCSTIFISSPPPPSSFCLIVFSPPPSLFPRNKKEINHEPVDVHPSIPDPYWSTPIFFFLPRLITLLIETKQFLKKIHPPFFFPFFLIKIIILSDGSRCQK